MPVGGHPNLDTANVEGKLAYYNVNIIKIFLFNNCQPKTIGFRVLTSNLGHLHE